MHTERRLSMGMSALAAIVMAGAFEAHAESDLCAARDEVQDPLFYNIAPFSPGKEAVVAADMREYVARTKNRKVLYCLTLHPEGVPAMKKVEKALASYRRLKEELKGSDVELGILLQAILGHWPRVDKEIEPWQRSINQSGKEVRFCWLDPRFQDYIRTVAKLLAAEEPCFILGDDDIRAFSPEAECFCPLHAAEFNRRRGTSYTSEQMRTAVASSKPGDPDCETFMALQREQVNGVVRLIREGIDSVNPAIPAGTCMPGWEYRFNDKASRIIAAKGQVPVMRLANGQYHEWRWGLPEFVKITQRTQGMYAYHHDKVGAILSEADTFPHHLWSRSSTSLHAHLVMTFFTGLKGAKLWYVNAHKESGRPVSRKYTERLSENSGLYHTLVRELSGAEFLGLIEPCLTNFPSWHPVKSCAYERFVSRGTWATELLGMMGIPSTVSRDYRREGIWTLAGEHAVSRLPDDDLKAILSHRVLVDGRAAVALTKRGFADLMGARALPEPVVFTREVDVADGVEYILRKRDGVPKLELLDGARRLTSLVYSPYEGADESEDAGPGSCVFENRLGGKVVVSAFHTGISYDRLRNESRQDWLFRMIDILSDKQSIPCVANRQDVMVLAARKQDGDVLMAVFNLNFEPMSSIELRVKGKPEISLLGGDGNWSKADVEQMEGGLNIRYGVPCYGVVVLKLGTSSL